MPPSNDLPAPAPEVESDDSAPTAGASLRSRLAPTAEAIRMNAATNIYSGGAQTSSSCPVCGSSFTVRRTGQRYCTDACRQRWRRATEGVKKMETTAELERARREVERISVEHVELAEAIAVAELELEAERFGRAEALARAEAAEADAAYWRARAGLLDSLSQQPPCEPVTPSPTITPTTLEVTP